MGEYRFKPALVRSAQTWALRDGKISGPSVNSLPLNETAAIRFIDSRVKRMANAQITIKSKAQSANIICNEQVFGQNRRQFLGLAEEIFSYLATNRPDLQVNVGFPKLARAAIALSGGFLTLVGLAIAASSSSSSSGTATLILGLVMSVPGLWMIWSNAPWRPGPSISVSEALTRVRSAE